MSFFHGILFLFISVCVCYAKFHISLISFSVSHTSTHTCIQNTVLFRALLCAVPIKYTGTQPRIISTPVNTKDMALSFLNYHLNSPFSLIEDISVPDIVELFISAESGKIIHSEREKIPCKVSHCRRTCSYAYVISVNFHVLLLSVTQVAEYLTDKSTMHSLTCLFAVT